MTRTQPHENDETPAPPMGDPIEQPTTDDSGAEPFSMAQVLNTPEAKAAIQAIASEQVAAMVAQMIGSQVPGVVQQAIAQANSKPPLTMRANVHDRFITTANGSGEPLKRYRCDRAKSTKIAEYNMDLLEQYEADPTSIPVGRTVNGVQQRQGALQAAWIKGSWIVFVDGRCACFTENQIRNVERLRTLPREQGGMDDIYEDTGGGLWFCPVCRDSIPPFPNKETWANHIAATHKEAVAA